MTTLRGVICDIDGTLVDSNDAHARAWFDAFNEQGYSIPYEKIRKLIGMGGDNLLPETLGLQKDSAKGKQLSENWAKIFKERYLPTIKPFPWVRELVQRMHTSGLKLVIGSPAKADQVKALLEIAQVSDLFDERTSADDVKNSKPDPDLIQAALNKIGLPAEDVILLGDTPYDIEAAHKVGVRTIAVRSGGFSDDELGGAIAIYNDPGDLFVHYDASPLATETVVSAK